MGASPQTPRLAALEWLLSKDLNSLCYSRLDRNALDCKEFEMIEVNHDQQEHPSLARVWSISALHP